MTLNFFLGGLGFSQLRAVCEAWGSNSILWHKPTSPKFHRGSKRGTTSSSSSPCLGRLTHYHSRIMTKRYFKMAAHSKGPFTPGASDARVLAYNTLKSMGPCRLAASASASLNGPVDFNVFIPKRARRSSLVSPIWWTALPM